MIEKNNVFVKGNWAKKIADIPPHGTEIGYGMNLPENRQRRQNKPLKFARLHPPSLSSLLLNKLLPPAALPMFHGPNF
jgi:hypothetical protein